MKKLFPIACLAIVVAALSSCTKRYVTEGTPNQTVFYTVPAAKWAQSADGKVDSVTLNAPDIDRYFNKNGATLVYFSFFQGVYEQIPEVYNNVAYNYIHRPGEVILYAQPPGGGTPVKPTSDMTVKLVLISSDAQ